MNFKLKEKMTLEQRVKPTELMAFWILVLFLFGWGIVTASFIDAKDPYTKGHSIRVAYYARELAVRMGLPENDVKKRTVGRSLTQI